MGRDRDTAFEMYEIRKKKKKRKRTVITPEEVDRLENLFKQEPLPDRLAKMELAKEMGKSEAFVNIWFQNRRARERKMGKPSGSEKECQSDPTLTQPVSNILEKPLDLRIKTTGETPRSDRTPNDTKPGSIVRSPLFGRVIRMAAAAEGGILPADCPHFGQALTDAWKGIKLADARLFYHPVYGFDVESKD